MFRPFAVALAAVAALCGAPARAETVVCLSQNNTIKVSSDFWLQGPAAGAACEVTHPLSQSVNVELLAPAAPMQIERVEVQIDGIACPPTGSPEQISITWKNAPPNPPSNTTVSCAVRPGKWTFQVHYREKAQADVKQATASMTVKAPGMLVISPEGDNSFKLDPQLSTKTTGSDVFYFPDGVATQVGTITHGAEDTITFNADPPKGSALRLGPNLDVWATYGEKKKTPATPVKVETWCLEEVTRAGSDKTFIADSFDQAAVGWGSLGGPAVSGPSRTDKRALRRLPYLACIEPRADGSALFRIFDPAAPTRGDKFAPSPILPWLEPDRFVDVKLNPAAGVKDLKLTPGGVVTDGSGPTDLTGPEGFAAAATTSTSSTVMARVAPRTPGAWHLDATWKTSASSGDVSHSQRLELITLKSFQGAIRVGVGFSAVANDRAYGIQQTGGQTYLRVEQPVNVAPELVVGYAWFTEAGGRSYYPRRFKVRPAPYFGVGVLSTNPRPSGLPVAFFRSAHLGAELEIGKFSSVALVATARIIDRPKPWVAVDGLVTSTTNADLLRPAFSAGVGIIVNLSPLYFQTLSKYRTFPTEGLRP